MSHFFRAVFCCNEQTMIYNQLIKHVTYKEQKFLFYVA